MCRVFLCREDGKLQKWMFDDVMVTQMEDILKRPDSPYPYRERSNQVIPSANLLANAAYGINRKPWGKWNYRVLSCDQEFIERLWDLWNYLRTLPFLAKMTLSTEEKVVFGREYHTEGEQATPPNRGCGYWWKKSRPPMMDWGGCPAPGRSR